MNTNWLRDAHGSRLREALPNAQFGERHQAVLDAPCDLVWEALHRMSWSDLAIAKPLVFVRRPTTGRLGATCMETFARAGLLMEVPGEEVTMLLIGKPWSAVPRSRTATSVDQVRRFAEPGWLKYGMDWQLRALPDGRTFVVTHTLCEPTDIRARRRFGAYWTAIRAFSGLVRRDMLHALERLATAPTTDEAAEGRRPAEYVRTPTPHRA